MPIKRADKTAMPVRAPAARARDFVEVNAGYAAAIAGFLRLAFFSERRGYDDRADTSRH